MDQQLDEFSSPSRLESTLTPVILTPEIGETDLRACVDIYNSHWRSYLPLDSKLFRKRLESGHLFVGVKQDDRPILLLQTLSLDIPLEYIVNQSQNEDYFGIAQQVCRK